MTAMSVDCRERSSATWHAGAAWPRRCSRWVIAARPCAARLRQAWTFAGGFARPITAPCLVGGRDRHRPRGLRRRRFDEWVLMLGVADGQRPFAVPLADHEIESVDGR